MDAPARISLTHKSTIAQLARHPVLDELDGYDFLVYVRVLAAAGSSLETRITNHAIRPGDPRAVVSALRSLVRLGLIEIDYANGAPQTTRTIRVLR